MTQPPVDILQRIERLLLAGKQQEARLLLTEYLKSNPSSARAWWLMSQAVTDFNQQVDCLQRVLRLDPGNGPARERLEKLKAIGSQPPASSSAVLITESKPPELKTPPGSGPVASSRVNSPTSPQQSAPEKTAAPAPPAPAKPGDKAPAPAIKPKKKWWILYLLMAAFFIGVISIVAIYLWSQQKTKAAEEARANSLRETLEVAQLLTKLPSLTFSPTWTVSPTRTATPTATLTKTPTPTLKNTLTNTPPPPGQVGPVVGLYAPDFSLIQLGTGLKVTLSQFAGKPVLVFFWDTRSSPCLDEIDSLKTIHQNYEGRGLVILAINVSESTSTVVTYLNSNHLTYRILLDQKYVTQTKYQVTSVPAHFFIDSNGRITYIGAGSMGFNQLESQVKAILP